jgi:hypothetical protein
MASPQAERPCPAIRKPGTASRAPRTFLTSSDSASMSCVFFTTGGKISVSCVVTPRSPFSIS